MTYQVGHSVSEETRRKMSEKAKLRVGEKNSFFGKKHSDKTKYKFRKAKLDKPTRFWLGKKRYPETVEKMRVASTGKKYSKDTIAKRVAKSMQVLPRGEKHHWWKGGVTPINMKVRKSYEYKLWRKAVLERDKRTCVWCGSKERIDVDHIKPFALYPELRFAIDNGRVLCRKCHQTTHTYGNKKGEKIISDIEQNLNGKS